MQHFTRNERNQSIPSQNRLFRIYHLTLLEKFLQALALLKFIKIQTA